MKAITDLLAKVLLTLAGVLITISTVSLLVQVISRYFFNAPTVWSEELAIFCFVWSTMLAVPVAFLRREHIVIDFVVTRLPERLQPWVIKGTDVICAATLGIIGYFSWLLLAAAGRQSLSGLSMLFETRVPTSALYLAIPVGCGLCVLLILYRLTVPLTEGVDGTEAVDSTRVEA